MHFQTCFVSADRDQISEDDRGICFADGIDKLMDVFGDKFVVGIQHLNIAVPRQLQGFVADMPKTHIPGL